MIYLWKLLFWITPKTLKKHILSRIMLSLDSYINEDWSKKNLIPLHQRIENIETELEKLKKK